MRNNPRLIFGLLSAQRRLVQWMATQTAPFEDAGLPVPSPAQGGVLFVLSQDDGATMGQLAMALDLAPSAVTGLVQRMGALGWVERRGDTADARTQRAWLTPAGRALLQPLRATTAAAQARLSEGFSPAELQTVGRWLGHVQQLAAADTETGAPADNQQEPRA